ncbi:MAG: FAD-dependent oxidoreductase [Treponema sp.]|jgi:NAD(P)H-nitrite reductase large subunit|nr:FAD-dependent oxidoreductase [Treponema sp.]
MKKYVILGASAAGVNAIGAIRSLDNKGLITLVSEDDAIYSRCILHHFLSGARDEKGLQFIDDDFIVKHKVNWKKGVCAVSLDPAARKVTLSDGSAEPYDKLLVATGARTAFPPIPGIQGENAARSAGIYGLRTLDDARNIKAAAKNAASIVILGGGLIGIDAASGLLDRGKPITLIEGQNNMLPLQLDKTAAQGYEQMFSKHGGKQYYHVTVKEIAKDANGAVSGVTLSDGTHIGCDMIVCATGVKANADVLENSGILVDAKGLVFNRRGETNDSAVYGAGDVGGKSPIWPLAVKEGIIAGANMAGASMEHADFFGSKSAMSFWGIKTLSMGIHTPPDTSYTIEIEQRDGNYKKIVHKNGRIYGALIQGDLSYAGILTQLIAQKIDVSRVRKSLFSIDYSDFFTLKQNLEFTYEEV